MFLVRTARGCHPVERKHKALSLTVMMENHFCTCIFSQQDLFPSPYPLPSTHSLKTHTHSHVLHTRFSLRKRESRQKHRSGRKIHFVERKTKDTNFAICYSKWEADLYGYISLHQFDSKHSRYLILFNTGFSSFSFQNCSSFCMGSVVYFYVFKCHKQTPDSFG